MVGGKGDADVADYAGRTEDLELTLDGVANDGASGEADLIAADVEAAIGGRGDDTITGDAAPNTLRGGDGADSITGGDGADRFIGDAGDDAFFSNDELADSINGGDGFDTIEKDALDVVTQIP